MSLNAAAIRLLAEKGLSALDIAEVAECMEASKPRSANAERQARYRERQREASVTNNVTRNATDDNSPSLSRPLSPQTPLSPTHTHPETKTRARKGTRLADDWQPEPLTGKALAMVGTWQAGEIERELAKFRNFWTSRSRDAARTDWQKTWVNWLINADERKPRNDRKPYLDRPAEHAGLGKTGAAFAALRDMLANGEPGDGAAGAGTMRNVTPRPGFG